MGMVTSKLERRQAFTINQVLSLYHIAKNHKGIIYLIAEKRAIQVNSLPKLLSFLLFSTKDNQFKVLIEGKKVNEVYEKIQAIFTGNVESETVRYVLNPNKKIQV